MTRKRRIYYAVDVHVRLSLYEFYRKFGSSFCIFPIFIYTDFSPSN